MANPNVETVNPSSGKWLLVVAFLLVVAGVIGFTCWRSSRATSEQHR